MCVPLLGLLASTGGGTAQADHLTVPTGAPAARTTTAPSRAGLGIRLLEAPVSRRNDPRAWAGVVDHLSPGTTIKRRFEVSNTTKRRLHVELYAAAADVRNQTFVYAPERTPNELSSWTTVEPAELDVPARQTRVGRFTIRVPKTAWRGERYAEIWAQTGVSPDETHNVGLAARAGIRVFLDVGPGGEPPSDMRIEKLTPERNADGRPQLLAQVRNTGGRALVISGQLSLTDGPEGIRAGPYPATQGVALRPDETGQVAVVLGKRLPNGPWKAHLALQSGMVKRKATATLTFPDSGTGRSVSLLSAGHLLLPSVLAVPVLAATGGFFLLRRRRRANPRSI